MKSLAIAATNLRRFIRDRGNIFFVFIFPMLLILVLGSSFGGDFNARLAVVVESEGELARDVVTRLTELDTLNVIEIETEPAAVRGVERGELEAAVIIPADYDSAITAGIPVDVQFLARSGQEGNSLRSNLESVVTQQAVVLRAARFAELEGLTTFTEALAIAEETADNIGPVSVEVTALGEAFSLDLLGQFDSSA